MSDTTNIERIGELVDNPAEFAKVMGFELQPWQAKFLRALAERNAARSGEKPTSYTVAADAEKRLDAQELLVRADEIKVWLDDTVKVGTHEGRTMVFNKRDAANKIAQIINDRYNARKR